MNDTEVEVFDSHRPFMLSIAYRMLGSRTEAEDIVQKAYLRYQSAARSDIVSHKAFFSTMITRLCLNHLQLAQNQRETYIGTWLPEPTLTAQDDELTPPEQTELHESLSMAFLLLLEQLTPDECDRVVEAGTVEDLADVPPEFLARAKAKGRALLEARGHRRRRLVTPRRRVRVADSFF